MGSALNLSQDLGWDEICIVDDSLLTRLVTQRICENYFSTIPIKTFDCVDSAMEHMRKYVKTRRVIFLDINMPHRDGWDFIENYRPASNEKLYILSSSELEADKFRANTYHTVSQFISKPISREKLNMIFENA